MPEEYYQNSVYPFQDELLRLLMETSVPFYLTGGTALSRFYLKHRYSDDLDFFVNRDPNFRQHCRVIIERIKETNITPEIGTSSDSFLRVIVKKSGIHMKIDFVNDVPFHYGEFEKFQIFNKVDNWRNILSNKICALSRYEPKDVVDILFVAKKYEFEWEEVLKEAQEKDLWVEPIEISKIIKEFKSEFFNSINWVEPPNITELSQLIKIVSQDIFYGNPNSIVINE